MKKISFILFLITRCFYPLVAQTWLPMDKGINCFYTGDVKKIVVDSVNDQLFICGSFGQEGNCNSLLGTAKWNGMHFEAIGALKGTPMKYGMGLYNDTLYASGIFYDSTISIYYAKWNGSYWDTLPKGPSEVVFTSLQKENVLYIGGGFDHIADDSTFLLGKYDGHQFSAITPYYGPQGGYSVNSLVYFQDTLYVGGRFSMWPYHNYDTFAKWYGNDLHPTASEFINSVGTSNIYSMAVYHNELYIAGYFRKVDGYTGNYIMKWDGHQLTEVGTGTDDLVTCMKVYNDALYIGGYFTHAGGILSNHVAKWNGTNWISVTTDTFTGSYPLISDIGVYRDSLIIAGNFVAINGDSTVNCVAKYSVPLTGIDESPLDNKVSVYPNPSSNQITLEFSEATTQTTILQIKNTLGQIIKKIPLARGNKQLEIDISDLAPGFYFVQMQSGNRMISKKFIKQ